MTTTTAVLVDHAAALKKAGDTYARKQKAADTAREAMVVVIRNASAGGMTKTAISDAAGVARETVYKALRGTPAADATDEQRQAAESLAADDALETGDRVTA